MLVFALSGALLSCRQIVNFDDAKRQAPDAGEATLPLLSFVPDSEFADACAACAKEQCASEREACLADATCRSLLACRGACSDPVCTARCGSFFAIDTTDSRALPPVTENAAFDHYDGCVAYLKCSLECGAGTTWGCLDARSYRWPQRVEEEAIRLQVALLDILTGAGAPAKLTARLLNGTFVTSTETRGWGQAELVFPAGFGMISIDAESTLGDWAALRFYPGPLFRATYIAFYAIPMTFQPPSPEPGSTSIFALLTDCMGSPASGVTFELDGATGKGWYDGAVQTSTAGLGGFMDITPVSGPITMMARRDGKLVARSKVDVAPDRVTMVKLWPLTRDD